MSTTQNTVTFDDLEQIVRRIDRAGRDLQRKVYRHEHSHELMQCDQCGHTVLACVLESDPRYTKRVSAGFNVYGPGDGEPPEYETVCLGCGAMDSFSVATTYAECGERPCLCEERSDAMLSEFDATHIDKILAGHGDWFTADLLRWIGGQPQHHRDAMGKQFPAEVSAVGTRATKQEVIPSWERLYGHADAINRGRLDRFLHQTASEPL